MTVGGWIFLVLSLGFVWSLALWCFHRVLTAPPADSVLANPDAEDPTGRVAPP